MVYSVLFIIISTRNHDDLIYLKFLTLSLYRSDDVISSPNAWHRYFNMIKYTSKLNLMNHCPGVNTLNSRAVTSVLIEY